MTLRLLLIFVLPTLARFLETHRDVVDQVHAAALRHRVPAGIVAGVCFRESGLGSARTPHARCGIAHVPNDLQADAAARALARWRAHCGSWPRAVSMFRTGSCSPDRYGYGAWVVRFARRLDVAAQVCGAW